MTIFRLSFTALLFITYSLLLTNTSVFAQTFGPIPVGGCPSGYTEGGGSCVYTGGGGGTFGPIPTGGCPPYYADNGQSSCQYKGFSFGPIPTGGCPPKYEDNKAGSCTYTGITPAQPGGSQNPPANSNPAPANNPSGTTSQPASTNTSSCQNFIDCLSKIKSPTDVNKFPDESGTIIPIALGIGGMLTVVFIIISGIQFITSGGDPKGAAAARARLIYAIIGFIILILAFAVLQIIDKLFLSSGIV
ncbi:hypothetical protein HYW40_00630 [Candidatus Curtissbacteria bacterium]|nr:hypothetical protein [Candidatus Curtissbacteria bacterium]